MSKMNELLVKLYESVEIDELARHTASYLSQPKETPEEPETKEEPESTFTDFVNNKIKNIQKTIINIQSAIENEQNAIRNGEIGAANGQRKIDSWKTSLNNSQYKMQILQKALDAYLTNSSEENELNLRIATAKAK